MSEHPLIRPRSLGEMLLDGVAIGLLGFLCLTLAANWTTLPDSIPVHFDLGGIPDTMADKTLLLILPFFALCSFIAFSFIRRIPHRFNYIHPITPDNAERQYRNAQLMMAWINAELVAAFSYLGWSSVRVALGHQTGLGTLFLTGMLVTPVCTIGLFLYRAHRLR